MSEDIRKFAQQHVAALAEPINDLVGRVIAKGLSGILEECCVLQRRVTELEEQLAEHAAPAATVGLDALREAVSDFRKAAIEFAKGMGSDDHKRMMEAQKRIFDAALAGTPAANAGALKIDKRLGESE